MAENPKRYSVSVSNAMKEELDVLKSSKYANVTMNRMLCDHRPFLKIFFHIP